MGDFSSHVNRPTQLIAQPPTVDVILPLLNTFFSFKAIHWWNVVPNDILTSATFKDDLFFACVNLVVSLCVHAYVVIIILLCWCLYLVFPFFFVCLYVCCVLLCSLPGKNGTELA